jgi:hypothetical protein
MRDNYDTRVLGPIAQLPRQRTVFLAVIPFLIFLARRSKCLLSSSTRLAKSSTLPCNIWSLLFSRFFLERLIADALMVL